MLKALFSECLLIATALLCVSSVGCRQKRQVEVAPVSVELTAMAQPPDAESILALRNTVAEVVQAIRNGQHQIVYDLLAPEIRRAVPFYEFLQRFGVKRNQAVNLPQNLPEPDLSRARDRVAEIFIMQPGDRTRTAVHLDLLRVGHRWLLRTIVVYGRPVHAFHYAGGVISLGTMFFNFNSIQIFEDLALGGLVLSHPDFSEGGGGAQMWLVRTGGVWRFYMYGSRWIA